MTTKAQNLTLPQLINRLVKISRPKFWFYTAGPYLLATVAIFRDQPEQLLSPIGLITLWGFIWFLFPANLLVYGINDLADQDTDQFNLKKNDQDEARLRRADLSPLHYSLLLSLLLSLPLFLTQSVGALYLFAFLFFSWGYSALPIRAKRLPFLDGIFNILYVLPAGVAFGLQGLFLDWPILLAGTLWCMSMHAISAIPDIEPDRRAGLQTTAVLLGRDQTLYYCLFCYLTGAALLYYSNQLLPIILFFFYIALVIFFLLNQKLTVAKLYPYYPIFNLISGTLLFFTILFAA